MLYVFRVIHVYQRLSTFIKEYVNLQKGESLDIRNDVVSKFQTREMYTRSIESQSQRLTVDALLDVLKEYDISLYEGHQTEVQLKEDQQKEDLSKFIDSIKEEFFGVRYISDIYLYEIYKEWYSNHSSGSRLNSTNFKKQLVSVMKKIGYQISFDKYGYRDRRDFNPNTFNVEDCYKYMCKLSGLSQTDKQRKQTYYELSSNYICQNDIDRVRDKVLNENQHEFETDQDKLIYNILELFVNRRQDSSNDSTYQFIKDIHHMIDGIQRISTRDMYAMYENWCKDSGYKDYIKTQRNFTDSVLRHAKTLLNLELSGPSDAIRFSKSFSFSVQYMLSYVSSISQTSGVYKSRYFENKINPITMKDVDQMTKKLDSLLTDIEAISNLTNREIIIIAYLSSTGHTIASQVYNQLT